VRLSAFAPLTVSLSHTHKKKKRDGVLSPPSSTTNANKQNHLPLQKTEKAVLRLVTLRFLWILSSSFFLVFNYRVMSKHQ
jgi:hypothetical protein